MIPADENSTAKTIECLAATVGLPLAPQYRLGVVENFERLLPQIELVMSFALPNTIGPAPVFLP